MARFPFYPGAGAKSIRGDIYWSRLYLQESARRPGAKDQHMQARWLNVNTNLNSFLVGWYKPVLTISDQLTEKETETLVERLDTVLDYRDTIASSRDYMSQSNLNKYVTQIKRFFLFVLKLTAKYDVFANGEERLLYYAYDTKEKDFVLWYTNLVSERRYFMGRPDTTQLKKIKMLHEKSLNLVRKEFKDE